MPIRRTTTTADVPLTSTSDIAFLLLIFFLVVLSQVNDVGQPLDLPNLDKTKQPEQQNESIELAIADDTTLTLNASTFTSMQDFQSALEKRLASAESPQQRAVIIQSAPGVTYQRWNQVIDFVSNAGGIPIPQIEERDE